MSYVHTYLIKNPQILGPEIDALGNTVHTYDK